MSAKAKQQQQQQQSSEQPSFFNLHVEGVGYLNRVRTIKPKGKKGQEFMACTVAALRGASNDVSYTKFDCRVSGAKVQEIVEILEPHVSAEKRVLVRFRIGDIYPESFTYGQGEREGQTGVSIKGRLLRIKSAKVDGTAVELPQQETEAASA